MENLPKRIIQHKIESDGVALLQRLLPDWYLFRKIDERDYGIDALLELVKGEEVTGKFVSIQIKSTKLVNWNGSYKFIMSIKKSTVNYWYNNNMPVVLILVDLDNEDAYFIDVKKYIRKNYLEFKKNNMSFEFKKNDSICGLDGDVKMLSAILNELDRSNFESVIIDFLNNFETYIEHLSHNGADFFLPVEDDFFAMTKRICTVLDYLGNKTYTQLEPIDFIGIREKCKKIYEDYYQNIYYELIEYEITEVHLKLQNWLEKVLINLKNYIMRFEEEYWKDKDIYLYNKLYYLNEDDVSALWGRC